MYRQAFLLNFTHVVAIRKIIGLYKDLIQGNVIEIPPYALDLPDEMPRNEENAEGENKPPPRLRNDSYLGAIHKENLLIRAGTQVGSTLLIWIFSYYTKVGTCIIACYNTAQIVV